MMKKNGMLVDRIKDGIVFDHMEVGSSLKVMSVLNLTETDFLKSNKILAVAMNVRSDKSDDSRKDVLKISDFSLSEALKEKLGLLIPDTTLNIIEEYQVVKKEVLSLPQSIQGIFCPDTDNCITNLRENVKTSFSVIGGKNNISIKCDFCDQSFLINDIWKSWTMLGESK